tara:strand:- start:20931 stop:21140 length:210 start_codon:yes stop_codon:yes gene_type:complete
MLELGEGEANGKCYKGKATLIKLGNIEFMIVASSDEELTTVANMIRNIKLKKQLNRFVTVFSSRGFHGH